MKKYSILTAVAVAIILVQATISPAWEAKGQIHGTEISYADLQLTKAGANVRLTNQSHTPVKVSLRLAFYGRNGNSIGYTLFGLREIPADSYVDISGNYLNGNWKACTDAYRMEWQKMTYQIVY